MNNQKYKKIIPYLTILIIVLGIILISYKANNLYPFGKNEIANIDVILEYKPILYNFITSLKNGTLHSFSFLSCLGNPTIFNYLYYLASPLNLVALPFNNPNAMLTSIIIVKTIVGAFTSLFYFKKKTSNNLISIICALAYIFSGWYLSYNIHIMWLDAFIIFPLLQYGLEELINNNKYNLYIFSLAYIIFSNFYISILVITYTIIYYIFNIIIKKVEYKAKLKNICIMFISTMLAFLLSAIIISIAYKVLMRTGITIDTVSDTSSKLNILNIIASLFIGNISSNYSLPNIPNLCLSLLFLISFIYYFLNNKISKKEKLSTLIATIIITLILLSNSLNSFLNNFHNITNYSFRYSFIITFYSLIIFIRNYKTFDQKIDKKVYVSILLVLILLVISFLSKTISLNLFIINLIFLLAYTLFIKLYKKDKNYKIFLTTIIIIECFINYQLSFTNVSEISQIDNTSKEKVDYRYSSDQNISVYTSLNQNLYNGYNEIETFSRLQYKDLIYFLDNLGCQTDLKTTIYNCVNTKVFNMLFNIDSDYILPKIYAVNKDIDLYNFDTEDFIDNQNNLVLGMSNIDSIIEFDNIEPLTKADKRNKDEKDQSEEKTSNDTQEFYTLTYQLNPNKEYILEYSINMLYIKIGDIIYTSNASYIPNKYQNLTINNELYFKKLLLIDSDKTNEIEISYRVEPEKTELKLYYVNPEKLEELYNSLESKSIKNISFKDNEIEGVITISDDELIFTSIPYDKSWEVYIDDTKVETRRISDALLGIECPSGTHKIKLVYKNNLTIPYSISTMTLIGLILNIIIKNIKRKNA